MKEIAITRTNSETNPEPVTFKPYSGRDINELIGEAQSALRQRYKSEPATDTAAWNKKVKGYGEIWTTITEREAGLFVVVGLTGNMSGVPVALFDSRESARNYADDFREGKIFTLRNAGLWKKYVRSAKLGSTRSLAYEAYGRNEGILPDGKRLTGAELYLLYQEGKTIGGLIAQNTNHQGGLNP